MTPRAKDRARPRGEVVHLRPALLPDRAAAAYLGRSASWIRAKRAEDAKAKGAGRDPTGPRWHTIERSVFYKLEDLDRWIAANAQERGVIPFANRGTAVAEAAK